MRDRHAQPKQQRNRNSQQDDGGAGTFTRNDPWPGLAKQHAVNLDEERSERDEQQYEHDAG
jgi:hypothetical protein